MIVPKAVKQTQWKYGLNTLKYQVSSVIFFKAIISSSNTLKDNLETL